MDNTKKIKELFARTTSFLLTSQKKEGSWKTDIIKHKEPEVLHKDIVVTGEAVLTLDITAELGDENAFSAINDGIFYCNNFEIKPMDPVEWWAFKCLVMKMSNTTLANSIVQKIEQYILNNQGKEGYWPRFPLTYYITNKMAIDALRDSKYKKELQKSINWFKKSMTQDKKGWGHDTEAEPSVTAVVVSALIVAGDDPLDNKIQIARKFLENSQYKDGSWCSTKLTIPKPTTYATALACDALMFTSEDPFNKFVEKGISFLLKNSSNKGGWPLVPGEPVEVYPTFYVANTLAFYNYLKERWEQEDIVFLKNHLAIARVVCLLYKEFENYKKNRFRKRVIIQITKSKALGTTHEAAKRRIAIVKILSDEGSKDVAGMIDSLKRLSEYSRFNKKSYMTQTKLDLEYLKDIKLINKKDNTYFIVYNFN